MINVFYENRRNDLSIIRLNIIFKVTIMDFILVLAKIQPKVGCQDSILELADELVYETLLEEGNIDYQLLKSSNDDTLTFVEKWESTEALKKHMNSPHFLNFQEESGEFVENMDIQVIDASEISL